MNLSNKSYFLFSIKNLVRVKSIIGIIPDLSFIAVNSKNVSKSFTSKNFTDIDLSNKFKLFIEKFFKYKQVNNICISSTK